MSWTHPAIAAHRHLLERLQAPADGAEACRCTEPDTWFDRAVCPEPCGSMHDYCSACGRVVGACPLLDAAEAAPVRALVAAVAAEHAPAVDGPGPARCTYRGHAEQTPWPCGRYQLAVAAS